MRMFVCIVTHAAVNIRIYKLTVTYEDTFNLCRGKNEDIFLLNTEKRHRFYSAVFVFYIRISSRVKIRKKHIIFLIKRRKTNANLRYPTKKKYPHKTHNNSYKNFQNGKPLMKINK